MIRPFFCWMNVALQGSMLPFVEAVKKHFYAAAVVQAYQL